MSNNVAGTIRPVMDVLLRMEETTTEWCPRTNRRVLCYLARHAQVLAGMTQPSESWNHETVFYPPTEGERGTRRIAGFPAPAEHVGGWFDGAALWQRMMHANWGFYCERIPRTAAHRFYVEPSPPWLHDVLRDSTLPHKTLLIMRDPRSELAEHWMSGRRRGALPPILNCIDSPLSFAERQSNRFVRARLADLTAVRGDADTLCVRCEDFLGDPRAVWDRVRAWLALPALPAPAPPATGHEWPPERWRPMLPQSVFDLYRKKMMKELEAAGYAS